MINLKNSNSKLYQTRGLNFIMKGKAPAIRLQAEPQRDYYSKVRGLIMNKQTKISEMRIWK